MTMFTGFRNCGGIPILTEFTTERYRAWVGVGSFLFWTAGISILPLIGYLVPAWRNLLLITAIVGVPALGMYW